MLIGQQQNFLSLQDTRVFLAIFNANYGTDQSKNIIRAAGILEGLDLAVNINDSLGYGLFYRGPDLYAKLSETSFLHYSAKYDLKNVSVNVKIKKRIKLDKIPRPPPLTFKNVRALAQSDLNRRRSIQNRDVVCKCGIMRDVLNFKSETSSNPNLTRTVNRTKAWSGFKKRVRCGNCLSCRVPKCKACKFCLLPHLKKPCVKRKCLFPKVPTCPCFAK